MSKAIMVIETGIIHPKPGVRKNFKKILSNMDDIQPDYFSSIEALTQLKTKDYKAVCIFLHRKVISEEALNALDEFVQAGGGFIAIHSASASFKTVPHYFKILGGRFTHHGPITKMTLHQNKEEPLSQEIFGNIPDFTVRDELYIHEFDPTNKIVLLTEAEGKKEPQGWLRFYGQGKIFYLSPGHISNTFNHPTVQDIIQKGMRWAIQ